MQNIADQETRMKLNNYSLYKTEANIVSDHTQQFIERSFRQSRDIAKLSGKMVCSVDNRVMTKPDITSKSMNKTLKINERLRLLFCALLNNGFKLISIT
jgi:hypothetical protein